ncbi:polysaccharide biosynthesis/export family protein [Pokkaliibacter sp. MBI-7]|uniref:polysaccharide biosynthesis/export family protein n=1 Tax=Pokkaliibacter sp. MBI-7 TaxID=3040600 RepID=UPI002446ACC1|nr:polysaccharide biosynthesis/export family protein [Pokkaliibacter sp. MBI-7]MDH2432980.1 polysaccharide biosynthesis/export family protein [Pokkaliibacter sp. MBI-7]
MRFTLVVLLLSAAMAGCSSRPELISMPVSTPTADTALSETLPVEQILRPQDVFDVIYHFSNESAQAYRIEAGDQVELSFLTAPNLSGSRLVMPDGTIPLPYVGSLLVAGLTVEKAKDAVQLAYSRVLQRPDVSLAVSRPQTELENLRQTLTTPGQGMTRSVTVSNDGYASFPLIGNIPVRGLTLSKLHSRVNDLYHQRNSQISVDVVLRSTVANEVFVMGEVQQPGAYPIQRPVSVLEALSLARGATIGAQLDSVVIMRRAGDKVEARVYNAKDVMAGKAAQFAYLQPDDLLYVPKTKLVAAAQLTRQLADVILFSGLNFGLSYSLSDDNSNN